MTDNEFLSEAERTEAFLAELSSLSLKYGIGIAGRPVLFVMERQDYVHSYCVNRNGNLVFRLAWSTTCFPI